MANALREQLNRMRRIASDPFDTRDYDDINPRRTKGGRDMTAPANPNRPRHRNGDPSGPQFAFGTDYSDDALVRAEFTYASGRKTAFKREQMVPANEAWADALKTLPPSVATGRFWIHELDNVETGIFLTDEELLNFANKGKDPSGPNVFKDVEKAAAALRFNMAWLQVDEEGVPVCDRNGQFIIIDIDPRPVYEPIRPATRRSPAPADPPADTAPRA